MRQYIGVPMPPAPLLLADKWFYTQSSQSAKLFSNRRNWDSPTPHPQANVPPSPFGPGGGAHITGERGGGRVSIPTRGHTLCMVLCKYMYFVVKKKSGGPNSSERLAYFQANRILTEHYKQDTAIEKEKERQRSH